MKNVLPLLLVTLVVFTGGFWFFRDPLPLIAVTHNPDNNAVTPQATAATAPTKVQDSIPVHSKWSLDGPNENTSPYLGVSTCSDSVETENLLKFEPTPIVEFVLRRFTLEDGPNPSDENHITYRIVKFGSYNPKKDVVYDVISLIIDGYAHIESNDIINFLHAKRFLARHGEIVELTESEIATQGNEKANLLTQALEEGLSELKSKYKVETLEKKNWTFSSLVKPPCHIPFEPLNLKYETASNTKLAGVTYFSKEKNLYYFKDRATYFAQTPDHLAIHYAFENFFGYSNKGENYSCETGPGKREGPMNDHLRVVSNVLDIKDLEQIINENGKKAFIWKKENLSNYYDQYKYNSEMRSKYGPQKEASPETISKSEFIKKIPTVYLQDSVGRYYLCLNDIMDISSEGWAEPLIYVYSKHNESIEISLDETVHIMQSIPLAKNNKWIINTLSNGQLYFPLEKKVEPYIFWEGRNSEFPELPTQGDIVAKSELEQFFNQQLHHLGLRDREIKDFKKYWLKQLEQYPFVLIEFLVNEEVERYAPLTVSKNMDQITRVYMIYRPLTDSASNFPKKIYAPIPRKEGRILIEWSGPGVIRLH